MGIRDYFFIDYFRTAIPEYGIELRWARPLRVWIGRLYIRIGKW